MHNKYDACVIGSGPNGLAAAITLIRAGLSVSIFEAKESLGGGVRSTELTLPGFLHDVCSAIHPLAVASPFFQSLPLERFGLHWIYPYFPLAHPLDHYPSAYLSQSYEDQEFNQFFKKFIGKKWDILLPEILKPLLRTRHPFMLCKFSRYGLRSAESLWKRFSDHRTHALIAGLAAHAMLPLNQSPTSAVALILGSLGLTQGWPIAQGGSQKISDALTNYFISLGGTIHLNRKIDTLAQLPSTKLILCDVTPKQLLHIAGDWLPQKYKKRLQRYRYGPGVFKIDWALSQPIPWKDSHCLKAGTIHVGGSAEEIQQAEYETCKQAKHPEKPFIILGQQSLFDPSRAPQGKQTGWAYCHVPHGSCTDMTERIERQIERFAPGFRDCILARHTKNTQQLETYNSNYVGGDINGGIQTLFQLFYRPAHPWNPYVTPVKGLFICSSSTPPGGGVHGMCGHNAALSALNFFLK